MFTARRNLFAWTLLLIAATAHAGPDQSLRHDFGPTFVRPTQIPYATDNAYSTDKDELGRTLFFDQRLSRAGNQSCVSCHHPGLGWEMGLPKALGAQEMPRKSPTLLNLAWSETFFWDGRSADYGAQFHVALNSPKALAMTDDELVKRLRAVPGYAPLFAKAFPDGEVSVLNVGRALEVFQRGITSGPAPFDRWLSGDDQAMSRDAKAGAALFLGKANCVACHSGWNFSDDGFHDVGLADEDVGRGKILSLPAMQHAFKTPGLRSIERRKPYTHAGALTELSDVIEHYDRGGIARRPSLAPEIKPLRLSAREKKQLIEFLKSLTGQDKPVTTPMMPM